MKIPRIFIKESVSEKCLEEILNSKRDCLFNKKIDRLLSSCEQFLDLAHGSPEVKYSIGEKIANKYAYTLKNIENLSKRISLDPPWDKLYAESLGFYFSALINKIITENDTMNLTLSIKLSGAGSYLIKGKVLVHGDTGSWTGGYMKGGKLTVLGNVGDYTGYEMINGTIVVIGKAGGIVGYNAKGGELYFSNTDGLISRSCNAMVYERGIKIWSPETTNLFR